LPSPCQPLYLAFLSIPALTKNYRLQTGDLVLLLLQVLVLDLSPPSSAILGFELRVLLGRLTTT
jgi:hypothetical protein